VKIWEGGKGSERRIDIPYLLQHSGRGGGGEKWERGAVTETSLSCCSGGGGKFREKRGGKRGLPSYNTKPGKGWGERRRRRKWERRGREGGGGDGLFTVVFVGVGAEEREEKKGGGGRGKGKKKKKKEKKGSKRERG